MTVEKLKIDDFLAYKYLSNLNFSPDGNYLGFVLHRSDFEENRYLSSIWIYELASGRFTELTAGFQESSFIWIDKETVLFPAFREKKDKERKEAGEPFTVFYRIKISGGEAQRAFEVPLLVKQIEALSENSFVFTAIFEKDMNFEREKREEFLKKQKEEKDYQVLDEIPFWSNGSGFTNKKRIRLYLFEVDKGELTPISDELTNVEHFSVNKETRQLLFIGNSFKDKMEIRSDLYLYEIDQKRLSKLTHKESFDYAFCHFLGESIIFAGTNMKRYGINENPKFYSLNPKTREVRVITPDLDLSLHNSVNSDCRYGANRTTKVDGKYLYFVSTEWHSSYLNRIDLDGKIERLTADNGSVDGFDVHEGRVIFVGLRDMKLQELYELHENGEKQLSIFNEWVCRERSVVKPERFSFLSDDGIVLEGWVMKPVDFDSTKKYPAILDIHGGPKTVYGEVFFHEMQLWANEGYVVLYTNPRGSDGRGNEFADIRGKYGTLDYEDLMKFVDEATERYPFIDTNRIGVTGGSYGGYMTNWIIGHTDRFKAAVSQRSIANWISKFGTTDIGYFFVEDQHLATPWSDFEKLWWRSPMKYADKVKTPTLFIHSDEDYRCWLVEAIQMFTALKYYGVESKLVIFKGENHELSRSGKPKHRLRRLKEITEWFDKHLK
ncbi:MAG: S9 family peptidase [Pseudothermotoga sp.]